MSLLRFSQSVALPRVLACPLTVLAALSSATPAWANADEYAFTLVNDTSVDMLEFYASPQVANDWEGDLLGNEAVRENGDWTIITLSGDRGCIYDFLAVFSDGDKLEKYGINVCDLETHTYYEN
ncbi:hypothetical protein D0962_26510 [Leptolyngbyaceae cyanobacterium CCMR0082]|uniref:Uncharacterized protein n=2 Tax=Adonisia turfae TaxID=2950184 RepID=A0A6M0SDZ0_9CYAN|nr:hypothetical protein [Adonisia turfae]MDV3349581.1 hypothetical protein [Leptothoe sp. LEGE 181152]NEZ55578.1 hypothetical protein [Adonisia turfae CCMR0081]NEZ66273.1 hypothetical protein [Adonisia turfae CCMR0082]